MSKFSGMEQRPRSQGAVAVAEIVGELVVVVVVVVSGCDDEMGGRVLKTTSGPSRLRA